ncbi:hypothetical protein ORD22_11020 [Sporosarcina sp. GW1-11]|uniref:hypothetical protein n=1 Tax=Sporosarcina sp. GW1-11 TaxID=2899126 RepID=UPI00294E9036|nr:hypothetical protein [Sporosarcina sp. GW1-11]MDV6378746.1 hypothetical protein [Sporosarcina sp. GW1-11]
MAYRNFRPCKGCDPPNISKREPRCYDDKKIVHILVDLSMGAPVEITLKESKDHQQNGYYLQFDRNKRLIHFQPFGDSTVQEISLVDICTIKYSSY